MVEKICIGLPTRTFLVPLQIHGRDGDTIFPVAGAHHDIEGMVGVDHVDTRLVLSLSTR